MCKQAYPAKLGINGIVVFGASVFVPLLWYWMLSSKPLPPRVAPAPSQQAPAVVPGASAIVKGENSFAKYGASSATAPVAT